MNTTGLVRVTVAAPNRRIDLALPERAPVAEILPGLLAHAGPGLGDQGAGTGGWVLRRMDGDLLDTGRTLAANDVLDGEVLNLTPAHTDWPELEYDDLVDTPTGAARTWGPRHTRIAGFALATVAILLGLVAVLRAGPGWVAPGLWCLGAAAVLSVAGVLVARMLGDTGAGAVLGALALPFAVAGGGLTFAANLPVSGFGAAQLLAASVALTLVGLTGLLGIADRTALFTAATTTGLLGVAGGWLVSSAVLPGYGAAGVIAGAGLAFAPVLAALSIRLAGVPTPVVADLRTDDPAPYAAVLRADGLLTGLLAGLAAAVVPCELVLVGSGRASALILVGLLVVGFALRARQYPVVAQRAALIVAAAGGAGLLAAGPLMVDPARLLPVAGPLMLVLGAVAVLGALRARAAGPRLARTAELAEVLVVLAVVPVLVWVLGVYGYLRGLAG